MKQTVNFYDFERAFVSMGREDQFSYDGRLVLFDWLEESAEAIGEEIELDVIALCCDYDESSWQEIADNYRIDLSDCDDDDERYETVLEYLNDETIVCGETDNSIVYAAF